MQPERSRLTSRHSLMGTSEANPIGDTQALLGIAESLLGDSDADGALQVYNEVLATSPRNIDALAGKGHALMGLGRYEQAIRFLERAAAADPERANVWDMLGSAALATGDGEVALKAYTHLQRLGAEPSLNYLNLARAAYFALDLERARGYVDLSLAENPNMEMAKEWDSALGAIEDNAAFLIDVGRAHARRGRFENGLSLFVESLKERESLEGHMYAGRALLALGKAPDAVEHLSRAREMDPNRPDMLSHLAAALAISGDMVSAGSIYDDILTRQDDDLEALVGKAQLLVEAGDMSAARPVVDRLIALSPGQPETWFLQARILANEGRRVSARLSVERAIVRDPRSPLIWLEAAQVMDSLDQRALAQLCRARAEFAETGKTTDEAWTLSDGLADSTQEIKDLLAVELPNEQMAEALRNRATVFANLGQPQRALDCLDLLVERFPDFRTEELHRHRGSLLLKLGDPGAARVAFQKALELDPESVRARQAIERLDAFRV